MATNTSQNTRSSIDYGFHLPPPADGGTTETLAVSQQMLERYTHSIRERERKIVKMGDIVAEWKAAVIKQVGETNWKKFIEYSREQRMSNYGLKKFSHDSDGLAELALAKRKAREKSLTLLKDANLEPGGLKGIHRKFIKEIDSLLSPKEPEVQQLEIVPESKVPSAIREGKNNPWTIYRPPYHGWAWSYGWSRGGGYDPDLVNYLNVASGSVGHRSGYSNYDADDWDGLMLDFDTSVGVWYWPPHAGQVVMWVKARCANAGYRVWLDDEMGWSDSRTMMHSYITANVSPATIDEGISQTWSFNVSGSPDSTTYSGNAIVPNSVIWFYLRTPDPIRDGAWSFIWVGTRDSHMSQLNDVSTDAVMRNWWYFEELWLNV